MLRLALVLVVAAAPAFSQEPPSEIPPPLPEMGTAAPGTPPAEPKPPTSKALERYQDCFQKMIDAGATDNAFMRKCLGIANTEKKAAKKTPPALDAAKPAKAGVSGIRDCYQKLLADTKDLGVTPEGHVEPTARVKPDGTVASVSFATTAMTDAKLLACVRDKIKAWTFPKSKAEGPVDVALSFRLSTKPPRTAVAALAGGYPKVALPAKAELPPADVLAVFKRNAPKVRACYHDQLKRKPGATGRVGASLEVDADGKAQNVTLRDLGAADDAFDDTFRDCLVKELKRWRYPKPPGEAPVPVVYPPFVFAPKTGKEPQKAP